MIYLVGLFGLLGGFALALMILSHFLRDVTRDELLKDKSLRLKYGALAWFIALFSAWCAVSLYRVYFPEINP